MTRSTPILGLSFFHDTLETALSYSHKGGLFTFPSGPCLAEMDRDRDYYTALAQSDYILVDSGLLSLAWRLIRGVSLHRISGYRFLKYFLKEKTFRDSQSLRGSPSCFWVMPNQALMDMHLQWLNGQGVIVSPEDCYVAPDYKKTSIQDAAVLALIQEKKPKYIIITLGGGVQEKLGAFLKNSLEYQPTILCIGAAIAFLSGAQARIPLWADRCYLGWLFRIVHQPSIFLKRYLKAWRLVKLLLFYKETTPMETFE